VEEFMQIDLHPNYIEKKGKKQFVVISYNEFCKIEEKLNDYEDLIELRKIKKIEKNKKAKSLNEVKKELGIK
jgi:hypothetical protein